MNNGTPEEQTTAPENDFPEEILRFLNEALGQLPELGKPTNRFAVEYLPADNLMKEPIRLRSEPERAGRVIVFFPVFLKMRRRNQLEAFLRVMYRLLLSPMGDAIERIIQNHVRDEAARETIQSLLGQGTNEAIERIADFSGKFCPECYYRGGHGRGEEQPLPKRSPGQGPARSKQATRGKAPEDGNVLLLLAGSPAEA